MGKIAWQGKPPNRVEKLPAKNITKNVHVNDVVTDWSYALAGFFVPRFLVFPPANLSNFSRFRGNF